VAIANLFQQLIISGIVILVTLISNKIYFKKGKIEDITIEFSRWRNTLENFIQFKKYQYHQVFWQCAFQLTFTIFIISILAIFHEIIIGITGFIPLVVWMICAVYPIVKFCMRVIPRSVEKSVENIRILLEGNFN